MGDPTKGKFPIGACVDTKTVDHVKALIADATAKGAKVASGGSGSGGAFFEPTVIEGVKKDMRIYGEESFGPIVGVLRAKDIDHAVELANDCEYGLSAAVFSRDINTALKVAQRIDSGNLSHQQPHRAGRGTDALRRHQGLGPGSFRRQGRHRGVHRSALDQHRHPASPLPDLNAPGWAACNAAHRGIAKTSNT